MCENKLESYAAPWGRTTEEATAWLHHQVQCFRRTTRSKITFLACIDRMTELCIPREIKERILSESCLDSPGWKSVDPFEFQECLVFVQELLEPLITQEEWKFSPRDTNAEIVSSLSKILWRFCEMTVLYGIFYKDFRHRTIIGSLHGLCYIEPELIDYEKYAQVFHPDLFRMLQIVDDTYSEALEREIQSDPIYEEIAEKYSSEKWNWEDLREFDNFEYVEMEEGISEQMLSEMVTSVLDQLGCGRDVGVDTRIEKLTKWQFLNGFTSLLFESAIPRGLVAISQMREERHGVLKNRLEDMYGTDVNVPDVETVFRNRETPLSYAYLTGNIRLEDVISLKKYRGIDFEDLKSARKLLDFQNQFEEQCRLSPTPNVMEMMNDPTWLARFPTVRTYLETENFYPIGSLVSCVLDCISIGIHEVELSYTMHPILSTNFDKLSHHGTYRIAFVRNFVTEIFRPFRELPKQPSNTPKRSLKNLRRKAKRAYYHGIDMHRVLSCTECTYKSRACRMLDHIKTQHDHVSKHSSSASREQPGIHSCPVCTYKAVARTMVDHIKTRHGHLLKHSSDASRKRQRTQCDDSDQPELVSLKCYRNTDGESMYTCSECSYSSVGEDMISHIQTQHHQVLYIAD